MVRLPSWPRCGPEARLLLAKDRRRYAEDQSRPTFRRLVARESTTDARLDVETRWLPSGTVRDSVWSGGRRTHVCHINEIARACHHGDTIANTAAL